MKNLYDKINCIIEQCTSVKKIVSKNKWIKGWMTASLLCSTRKKNELSMKMKKHPLNNLLCKYYKSYRNKLNSLIIINFSLSFLQNFRINGTESKQMHFLLNIITIKCMWLKTIIIIQGIMYATISGGLLYGDRFFFLYWEKQYILNIKILKLKLNIKLKLQCIIILIKCMNMYVFNELNELWIT